MTMEMLDFGHFGYPKVVNNWFPKGFSRPLTRSSGPGLLMLR